MEFRSMTSSDIERMVALEKEMRVQESDVFPELNEDKYRKNFINNMIEAYDNNEVILCLEGDQVIGRVDLIVEQSFMDFEKVGYVDWVYVLKSHRNKGIAKKLFQKAEEFFISNDVVQYYLFVAGNDEAKHFYNSLDIEIKTIEKATKYFKRS